MRDGDRGVGAFPPLQQQGGQGFPDDVAAPAHHHVFAGRVVAVAQKNLLDSGRGGGNEVGDALQQLAQVKGMQTVHILGRVQGLDYDRFLDLGRQRQLNEDAVEPGVGVELRNQVQQFGLGGCLVEVEDLAEHPRLVAGPALVPHVDGGRGVTAHQHCRQAGGNAVLLLHLRHASGHLGPHFLPQRGPIQNLCHQTLTSYENRKNSITGQPSPQRRVECRGSAFRWSYSWGTLGSRSLELRIEAATIRARADGM